MKAAGYDGANVTGIDIWQGGLDHATTRDFYARLEKVDLQAAPYPFADAEFDAVVSAGVLTCAGQEDGCELSRLGGGVSMV